jgi:hypothetical protein
MAMDQQILCQPDERRRGRIRPKNPHPGGRSGRSSTTTRAGRRQYVPQRRARRRLGDRHAAEPPATDRRRAPRPGRLPQECAFRHVARTTACPEAARTRSTFRGVAPGAGTPMGAPGPVATRCAMRAAVRPGRGQYGRKPPTATGRSVSNERQEAARDHVNDAFPRLRETRRRAARAAQRPGTRSVVPRRALRQARAFAPRVPCRAPHRATVRAKKNGRRPHRCLQSGRNQDSRRPQTGK